MKLERVSRRLGVELYVKRDDLTGLLESGNKVRKLEFLVGEALEQRADTLMTCGTLQSNCCRAVAAVAARLGLNAVLAVKGARPAAYDGNLLLDRLLGAEIRYLSDDEWGRVDGVLEEMAAELRARGHRPYVIPESGSNEVGALGYLECAVELAEQIGHGAPRFDAVVISAYSGGSQAGLLMGKQLAGLPSEIVGVPIAWPADKVREHVEQTMTEVDPALRLRHRGAEVDSPPRRLPGGTDARRWGKPSWPRWSASRARKGWSSIPSIPPRPSRAPRHPRQGSEGPRTASLFHPYRRHL